MLMKVSDIIMKTDIICEEILKKIRSSRFRDIQKRLKVQILIQNEVALIQVVRKRVIFQDRRNKNNPKFRSIKI